MSSSSEEVKYDKMKDWEKFSNYLWFNDELQIWLDISKVNFDFNDFQNLENQFNEVYLALDELEKGAISNIDEKRQVGHYWLRNSSISPNKEIKNIIDGEILKINNFSNMIHNGEILNKNGERFTDVLWIGIGGSGLGPLLIIESLQKNNQGLNFLFIDNVDPFLISEKLIDMEEKLSRTLFVVVSKSGGTPEPRIAMEIIRRNIEEKGIDWCANSIAITMTDSELYKKAKNENWLEIFNLPDWVGGRTSITSSVGLLAISLIKENIYDFLKGASIMDEITRSKEFISNPAALLSASWFFCGEGIGKRDMVVLPYRDRLQVFSKYLQQLVMESLGKKYDRDGNIVHQGISVFGNKGSTDQHAYVQQLRDGIDNFFCIFIELLDSPENLNTFELDDPKSYLSGFLQGTRTALTNQNRQSITLTLSNFNVGKLGAIIALFERAVSFYAELVNINAYDQPGVEAGKMAASEVILYQQKVKYIINKGDRLNFSEICQKLNDPNPEIIFFILRQLCFNNKDYSVSGNWSIPDSLYFQKLNLN
tara:strand:+ start:885 stop:2495 length:1611 start_codon:yes stop_codon:yes gene_type:complete